MTEDYKTPTGAPPDWRGLCAELTEHLALLDEPPHELVCRAQEALAEPVGVALQRPESFEFALDFLGDPEASELRAYIEQLEARAALAQPEPEVVGPTDEELRELRYYGFTTSTGHGERVDEIGFARAVLARWGRPAPAPVPVSERLPGPEDCDAEGRCWWFCLECPGEHSYWILAKEVYCEPTYWLPATALPLPQGEVE